MAAAQRIKVNVQDLLRRVTLARDTAMQDYEDKLREYDAVRARVRKATIEALRAEISRLRTGGDPVLDSPGWKGDRVTIQLPTLSSDDVLDEPREPNYSSYDRDIALLEMASDETISISTDSNWGRYL